MAPRHSISKLQVSVLKNKDKTIIGISLTVNFTKIHLDVKSILGLYLQSLFMPTSKHFCRRQCAHQFRLALSIAQSLSPARNEHY